MQNGTEGVVFPIFYDVEPSEVRKQSGNYGMAFAKHEKCFGITDKVHKWRDALTKVANMSGWDLRGIANGYESKFIHAIIKDVQLILQHVPIFVATHIVGLDSRVEHVIQLLCGEPNDGVRIIGIFGMGGIGKTTLARAVYNRLFGYFESSCFLEIESTISGRQDNLIDIEKVNNQIKVVQKELLEKLFNEVIKITNVGEGIMLLQKRLQVKKCLIVLDNLEHINQFNALCGERNWFNRGSRLILTTRETHVLKRLKEDERYETKGLNREKSLQLFCLHAFGEPIPKEDYTKLANDIVAHCVGLPLALEVLGTYLFDKTREEWISAFEKLKKIPHKDVQAKLKISYDGLRDDSTKSAFLDLVCFTGGCDKDTIDSMGNFSNIEIRDLVDKCLIKQGWGSRITTRISMHDLIRAMGREIIRLESPNNPGERSRLWCPKDIHDVLIGKKGTKKVEVIVFKDSPMKNMKYNTKAFKNMKNLRYLQINGENIYLDGKFKHLSKELRCLQWNCCPLKYINIPSNCSFRKLVKLEMKQSNIKEFRAPLKCFSCLEYVNLSFSKYLTKTPDFSGAQNLRMLSFRGCENLVKVHSSIGELVRLKDLDFGFCSKLRKLPNNLCHLLSLESIGLDFCEKLQVLPKLSHSVENLFYLSNCVNLYMVQDFPPILTHICLYNCKNLQKLPQLPPNLERINLSSCKKLKILPQLPQKLTSLEARNCVSLEKVPNLSKCTGLYELDFSGCRKLKEIQGWENLHSLLILKLGGTPHNILSNNIKEILIGPKLESDFTCTLTCNEVPSWIRCKEEGSLLSFQWPLNNSSENYTMGFLGLFFWVVFKAQPLPHRDVVVSIQINGLGVKIYGYEIQYEVEEISFLHWSPRDDGLGTHIKVGEVMKVSVDETQVKASMVKKIGVVALYRDTDGFVQFVPITKVGLTTKKRKRNLRG